VVSQEAGIKLWSYNDPSSGDTFGNLENISPQPFIVQLTNIESKILWQESFLAIAEDQLRFPIPMKHFPPGMYLLQAIFEDKTTVIVKILKY